MKDELEILKLYKNRQVVINHYEDDELVDKTGLFFDIIDITTNEVHFVKDDKIVHRINIKKFPHFLALEDFKNYYSFSNETTTIEIYFP